jgi:hypothetical protein
MRPFGPFLVAFMVLTCWVGGSCGELRPLWKGEFPLENYTLYYSEPIEFSIPLQDYLTQPVTAMLELEVVYYVGITRTSLPLFIALEDKNHEVKEYSANIVLKEDGEWLGVPRDNEIDVSLTYPIVDGLELKPEPYTLKIYSNDTEAEKVYGVVSVTARLYEQAEGPKAPVAE